MTTIVQNVWRICLILFIGGLAYCDIHAMQQKIIDYKKDREHRCLHEAIGRGEQKDVEKFLTIENLEGCYKGMPPLMCAIEQGHTKIALFLIERGADLKAADSQGKSIVHAAAERGNLAVLRICRARGVDCTLVDKLERTPLHVAAVGGHCDILVELISAGLSVNSVNRLGDTPLHSAACNNQGEAAALLLDNGAVINSRNKQGEEPLHAACAVFADNSAAISVLIDRGADCNGTSGKGKSPLMCAILRSVESVIKLLVEKGADLMEHGQGKDLDFCAELIYPQIVPYLRSRGMAPHWLKAGETMTLSHGEVISFYHQAAKRGDIEAMARALDSGTPVCSRDETGCTSLHYAAKNGHLAAVTFLLDKDILVDGINERAHSSPFSFLFSLEKIGQLHYMIIDLILARGQHIADTTADGMTLLHHACKSGDRAFAAWCIEKGIPVNAQDKHGQTALHYVASGGELSMVCLLLDAGAAMNGVDREGKTPLLISCAAKSADIALHLLEKGADVTVKDVKNRGCLHYVACCGNRNLVEALIARGMMLEEKDVSGATPLKVALESNNRDSAVLFIARSEPQTFFDKTGRMQHTDYLENPRMKEYLSTLTFDSACLEMGRWWLFGADEARNVNLAKEYLAKIFSYKESSRVSQCRASLYLAISSYLGWEGERDSACIEHYCKQAQALAAGCSWEDAMEIRNIVTILENKDFDVTDVRNENGSSLKSASFWGLIDLAELLILLSTPGNPSENYMPPPLSSALMHGKESYALYFLSKKTAHVALATEGASKLLLAAVATKSVKVVERLLALGVDPNEGDYQYPSPLRLAIQNYMSDKDQPSLEIIKLLLIKGGTFKKNDRQCVVTFYSAVDQELLWLVELLVSQKLVDVNRSMFFCKRPLQWAALKGNVKIFQYLLDHGADVWGIDETGLNALHTAASCGRVDIIKMLLVKGAPIDNSSNLFKLTPLHCAAEEGHADCVRLLLAHRAGYNARDYKGQRALDCAMKNGHQKCVEILRAHDARSTNDLQ